MSKEGNRVTNKEYLTIERAKLKEYSSIFLGGQEYFIPKNKVNNFYDGKIRSIDEVYSLKNEIEDSLELKQISAKSLIRKIQIEILGKSTIPDYNLNWTGLNNLCEEDMNYLNKNNFRP